MQFEIIKGNIINAATDAIVLPANPTLQEGTGTSAAIFEAAGRKKLSMACKKVLKQCGGKCEVGSAIPTLAFGLEENNTKFIIHAIVPIWIDGDHQEYDNLCSAYLSSLKIAELMECTSIAFPLLASGNNGFDKELALEIADRSFKDFEGNSIQKIVLVIYGDDTAAFVKEKGYEYSIEIPDFIAMEKKNLHQEQKAQARQKSILFRQVKDTAQSIFEERLNSALEYIKDPENQKALLAKATILVNLAKAFLKK